jgi:HD-GYP domain-containing protein (c-di-GMP phosphodiesterase class II)
MRSGHTVNHILLKEFKRRRIGRIEFAGLPGIRDLEEFLRSLTMTNDNGQVDGDEIQKILEEKHIESLRVLSAVPAEGDPESGLSHDRRAQYTRVYFYALELMRTLFADTKQGETLDLDLPRQVARSLISGCADAPATFMGLATTKRNRPFLANHSVNVAIYAVALGHRLGLSNRFLTDLALAALVHDIGETQLDWLRGTVKGDLSDRRWREARMHPVVGVKVIMGATGLDQTTMSCLIEGVFGHHLGYNLSGFPRLRRKRKPSLVARIISLADFYDMATRPYGRKRFPCFSDRTAALIMDRAATDFDPILAKYFVRILGILPVGTLCRLDTGELGIVFSQMEEGTTGERPWVQLLIPDGKTYKNGDFVCLDSVDEKGGKYRRSIQAIVDPNPLGIDVAEHLIPF